MRLVSAALMGGLIAYRTKKYIYTLLGPFAGYVSGAPAFDVYEPWQMFLVSLAAPLVAYAVYEWTQKRELDEHKLTPLFLGVGSGAILQVIVEVGSYLVRSSQQRGTWLSSTNFVGFAAGLVVMYLTAFLVNV